MLLARILHVLFAWSPLWVASTLLAPATGQDPLAPPRGFFGPGSGDVSQGGPGDSGDASVTDSASWTRWWAFNREAYLVAVRGIDPSVLQPAPLEPHGGVPASPWRPDEGPLYGDAVPEILSRLGRTRDLDIQRAAVMALAKIGPPPKGR